MTVRKRDRETERRKDRKTMTETDSPTPKGVSQKPNIAEIWKAQLPPIGQDHNPEK